MASSLSISASMRLVAPGILAALLATSPPPATAAPQDAQSILSTMREKQAQRWANVDNYTIVKSVDITGGLQVPQYFEKIAVDGQPTFRLVPAPVYEREMLAKAGFPPPSADAYEAMADAYDMLGPALEAGGGDQPPMPGVSQMTSQMAEFLRGAAKGTRNLDDGTADAEDAVADMAEFARRARLAGTEPAPAHPDGATRAAYKLVVDGLEMKQEAEGGTFALHTATLWLDTEYYVPLRLVMEGEVESEGRTAPLTIEKLDLDYRAHGPLYVPHREVFRLSGIMQAMSEKERREMEEAKKQLAEAEEQIKAMPPEQREMVERMMGDKLEQLKKMVEGDSFETTMSVVSVAVNEGPPTPYGLGELFVGSVHFPGALTMASEAAGEGGQLTANLDVAARLADGTETTFNLVGGAVFPDEGGSVAVTDASGSVEYPDGEVVVIDSGTGSITVELRTETRIAGTFEAQLTSAGPDGAPVTVNVNGKFDSGAPAGPYRAPRGSPVPALFGM